MWTTVSSREKLDRFEKISYNANEDSFSLNTHLATDLRQFNFLATDTNMDIADKSMELQPQPQFEIMPSRPALSSVKECKKTA